MKTTVKAIGRARELQWLADSTRFARLLAVTGPRGIGKRTLVKTWLDSTGATYDWIAVQPGAGLRETLAPASRSDEEALGHLRARWHNSSHVVWENLDRLESEARRLLLSFLKSDPRFPLQLFLSETSLESDSGSDLLELALKGLDAAGIAEFLIEMKRPAAPADVARAAAESSGVPLLLHLHTMSPGSSQRYWIEALSKLTLAERRGFAWLALSGQELAADELATATGAGPDFAARLESLVLATRSPHDPRRISASEPAALSLRRTLGVGELATLSTELARFLIASPSVSPRRRVEAALQNGLTAEAAALIDDRLLASLDRADMTSLETFATLALPRLSAASAPLARLQLRARLARNERREARALAELVAESLGTGLASFASLAVEVLQAFNRAGDTAGARAIGERLLPDLHGAERQAAQIELASASLDETTRRQRLDDALAAAESELAQTPTHDGWNLVRATAAFQRGRAFDIAGDIHSARVDYETAARHFDELGRFYQASVARLNTTWLSLKARDWNRLDDELQRHFLSQVSLLDPYVAAGYHLIRARASRHHLRFTEALHAIEAGERRLPPQAPYAARFDIGSEKIRVLLDLGLRTRARETWASLKPGLTAQTTLPPHLVSAANGVELEIAALAEPALSLRRRANEHPPEKSDLFVPLVLSFGAPDGETRASFPDLASLGPYEETIWREILAAEAWATGSRDQALYHLRRCAEICETSPEPSILKTAHRLIAAGFATDAESRLARLRDAETELSRLACDFGARLALELWLNALKAGESPADSPALGKLAALDRWRWQTWWSAAAPQDRATRAKTFEVMTERGLRSVTAARPTRDLTTGLFISELHGEVVYRGRSLPELKTKRVLKRMLIVLLEAGSEGLSKEELCILLWGENYNPMVHDARIYTSVVRLRRILADGAAEVVLTTDRGYACRPSFPWEILRLATRQNKWNNRLQNLIFYAFEEGRGRSKLRLTRAEIAPFVKTSEANLKRELRKLVEKNLIKRAGSGRTVTYSRA